MKTPVRESKPTGSGSGLRLLGLSLLAVLLTHGPVALSDWGSTGSAVSTIDSGGANAAKIADLARKAKDMHDKANALDPGDGNGRPDYNPPGMPEVPVSCQDNEDCWHCYTDANEKIKSLRESFEKLRLLYKETDDYTKASMAFGDGVSGSTGVAALEWNVQRERIKTSFKGFEVAYRGKYAKLLEQLQAALQEVAQCEKQYFDEDDWYARFGFMLHSFIALHYQK